MAATSVTNRIEQVLKGIAYEDMPPISNPEDEIKDLLSLRGRIIDGYDSTRFCPVRLMDTIAVFAIDGIELRNERLAWLCIDPDTPIKFYI